MAAADSCEQTALHVPAIKLESLADDKQNVVQMCSSNNTCSEYECSRELLNKTEASQAAIPCKTTGRKEVYLQHDHECPSDGSMFSKLDSNLAKLAPGRRPLLLVCNGAFNPIHRQHTRIFYLARKVHCNHEVTYLPNFHTVYFMTSF